MRNVKCQCNHDVLAIAAFPRRCVRVVLRKSGINPKCHKLYGGNRKRQKYIVPILQGSIHEGYDNRRHQKVCDWSIWSFSLSFYPEKLMCDYVPHSRTLQDSDEKDSE